MTPFLRYRRCAVEPGWEEQLAEVPAHLRDGLRRYVLEGIRPGQFLQAVIANDLADAVRRADRESLDGLGAVVLFLVAFAPAPCWGERGKLEAWLARPEPEARL